MTDNDLLSKERIIIAIVELATNLDMGDLEALYDVAAGDAAVMYLEVDNEGEAIAKQEKRRNKELA